MSFLDTLHQNARQHSQKTAVEFVDPPLQCLTYAELDAGIRRTMAYLHRKGVRTGERVALQLPKCLEFIYLHLASLRLGAVTLPLNPAYSPDELVYFLLDSEAKVFLTTENRREIVASLRPELPALKHCEYLRPEDPNHFDGVLAMSPPVSDLPEMIPSSSEDTAVMIYTSGTTGRPKGAMITHGNLTANLNALHTAWGWEEADRLLHALPLFHVHGLFVALHGALNAGASSLLMRQFNPRRVLEVLVDRRCTVFMAVPTIYQRILALPDAGSYDLRHMRLLTSGSDRLPDEVFQAFRETFGYTLLERYGMTETGMNLSNPLIGERRMGSVGFPLPGVEARITDPETGEPLPDGQVGEVQIRGPNVFKGYWRQPGQTAAAFTEDGWLRTGDIGLRDPDGYFTLQGRARDLIITGGLNVYPPEVERVLMEHPAVQAVAVIGCPDQEWGEVVLAVVVPHQGQQVPERELIHHCRRKLASYKCPRAIYYQGSLPRNAMGKVQKVILRQQLCQD